jgi:uncharacterized protein
MTKLLRLSVVVALAAFGAQAVDWRALRPEGCVSDFARVIDAGSRREIEEYCASVEGSTGAQLILVTIPSLEGEPGEDVAKAIFDAWGTGKEKPRILLMLAILERRSRLETGPGLAAILPEDLEASVLREMRPAVRRRHYGEALMAAASTLGDSVAQAKRVTLNASLRREIHTSAWDSIPWAMVLGGLLLLLWLTRAGGTRGYGGAGGSGFIPGIVSGSVWSRASWGSRGSGGFGGYDSEDSFGAFGGGGSKGRPACGRTSCDW